MVRDEPTHHARHNQAAHEQANRLHRRASAHRPSERMRSGSTVSFVIELWTIGDPSLSTSSTIH
jgi:hypothetical protein